MALKINRKLQNIFRVAGWVLLIIVAILIIKILVWESNYYETMDKTTRSAAVNVITSVEKLTSYKTELPTDEEIRDHSAANDEPLFLNIPRLEVHARILVSQADNGGQLPVTENIHDVLWYSGSALPGQNGASIFTGQNGDNDNNGVFANLEVLEKGDEIVVQLGNLVEKKYEVQEIYIVNEADLYQRLYLTQQKLDGKESLSLVTANTPSQNKTYESAVFIRATIKD